MSMYTPFIFISNNNTDVDSRALQWRQIGSCNCCVNTKNNRCANSSCRKCVGDVPKSTLILSFIVAWTTNSVVTHSWHTHLQSIAGHLFKVFYFQFPCIFAWVTAMVMQRTSRHFCILPFFFSCSSWISSLCITSHFCASCADINVLSISNPFHTWRQAKAQPEQ